MERVYSHAGFAGRSNISMIILVAVIIYGFFELWTAFGSASGDSTAAMFGVLFLGGGAYGVYSMWTDTRDLVSALDLDTATGRATVTLWRPLRPLTVTESTSAFSGWRYWVKIASRGAKTHFLIANLAGYPRPLYFEMPAGKPVADGLRKLAPEAVEDFETNTGARPEPDEELHQGEGAP